MPTSRWMRLSSTCICLRSFRSSAPSGSSSSSTTGRLISARASATRCCWPPDKWSGRRSSIPARETSASDSRTRRLTIGSGLTGHAGAEGDVLRHRHMRKQRIALEDGVHWPPIRGQMPDRAALDQHLACRRLDEAADDVERRRLPATAWAEQREEFAVANGKIDAAYRGHALVVHADGTKFNTRPVGRGDAGDRPALRPIGRLDLPYQVLRSGQRRGTPRAAAYLERSKGW